MHFIKKMCNTCARRTLCRLIHNFENVCTSLPPCAVLQSRGQAWSWSDRACSFPGIALPCLRLLAWGRQLRQFFRPSKRKPGLPESESAELPCESQTSTQWPAQHGEGAQPHTEKLKARSLRFRHQCSASLHSPPSQPHDTAQKTTPGYASDQSLRPVDTRPGNPRDSSLRLKAPAAAPLFSYFMAAMTRCTLQRQGVEEPDTMNEGHGKGKLPQRAGRNLLLAHSTPRDFRYTAT